MNVQSLSICVPASCPNNCKFCVAHMHKEDYVNQIEKNKRFRDLYKEDFKKRLLFARDNGCNTVILTGNGEPLMNQKFLEDFGEWNKNLLHPFYWIEVQTSGVLLNDEYLRFLRNSVGITTISLSLSSIFNDEKNFEYNGTPEQLRFDLEKLCSEIKRYDFNLRLSLNMTDEYNDKSAEEIFDRLKELGADQVTFRVLYKSSENPNSPQNKWIEEHGCLSSIINRINNYIERNGQKLELLPFGAMRYAVRDISTVVDNDCISVETKDTLKYLVLRPDCKLYTKWDTKGSILF